MGINRMIDINIAMGDLEYLMREGLNDPRALAPEGLEVTKRILRDALTLLERGKEYKEALEFLFGYADGTNELFIKQMEHIRKEYFPKREKTNSVGKIMQLVAAVIGNYNIEEWKPKEIRENTFKKEENKNENERKE